MSTKDDQDDQDHLTLWMWGYTTIFYNKRYFVCNFRQSHDQHNYLSCREDNYCEQAEQTNYTFKVVEEIFAIYKLIDGVSRISISISISYY